MAELNRRLAVNTQGLAPDAIRSAPVRGTTYSTPALKPTSSPLGDLLTGLSGLSPTLDKFAAERDAKERDEQTASAKDAFDGMTLDEARELVKSKKINEYESPYFRAAFLARLGQNEASSRKRQMVADFETKFDKVNGNIGQWVHEQAKADLSNLPDNDFVRRAYHAEMEGFADALSGKQVDAQVQEIK